jgi:hypothetical protein
MRFISPVRRACNTSAASGQVVLIASRIDTACSFALGESLWGEFISTSSLESADVSAEQVWTGRISRRQRKGLLRVLQRL